ncbi:unnamed protein product [Strongylus vulgaris]|uniref:Leishmanolysin-like peptidase n=1 Tax=Strongylus vulgaris TaxID=40348 RepID=A0A3P7JK59_STRVU|nr:unnamed protein product [Strongylus vulgaris]
MSGVATQVYAMSRLTLALFEDSGCKAENMQWGHTLGCKFAKQSCLTWMRTNPHNPYPFCTVLEDTRCSTSRLAKVRCNLIAGSIDVPNEYNYNIQNLYKDRKQHLLKGYGHLEVADYCPYYRVYGEFSAMDKGADTRCTFPGNMNYNNYSLEIFSPTARCFQLEGGITVIHDQGIDVWMHSVGCYEVCV